MTTEEKAAAKEEKRKKWWAENRPGFRMPSLEEVAEKKKAKEERRKLKIALEQSAAKSLGQPRQPRQKPLLGEPDAIEGTTLEFAEEYLKLPLYDWQARCLIPLEGATGPNAKRVNISIVTPNGSGKDDRLIPVAAYWWLFYHPRGKVVITSKSDLQLSGQTIPSLEKHWPKFGWPEPIRSPRWKLTTPTGGTLTAFVTNAAARMEGFHKEDDSNGPLLYMVNEAASVDDDMFVGVDRCTVNALILLSKPGLMIGRFFDTHTKLRDQWCCFKAGLTDCPHIPKEKIDYIIATYGEKHPITRSILYGEFMEQDDASSFCVPLSALINCLESPPRHHVGMRYAFWDFAEGRAENVCVLRDGNKYTIEDAFRETNESAVIGRVIQTCRRLGFTADQAQEHIGGDAAGKTILDGLSRAGWVLNRQNFGAPDKSGIYRSWGAMAWIEGGNKIKNRAVILPDDEVLKAQITTRKKLFTESGKLGIEDKLTMKKERALPSPDRGDALFGAMAALDMNAMYPKEPFSVTGWRDKLVEGTDNEFLASIGADAGI